MKKLILIMMMTALMISAKSQMLIGEKMVYFYDNGDDYIAEVIDTTSTNSLVFWVEFQNAPGSGYRGCSQLGGCVKHATSLMDALGGIERWATMEEAVSWGYTKYVQYLRKGMGTSSQYFRGDGELATFPTIPTNTNQLTNGAGFLTSYTETDPQFNTKFSGKSTSDLSEGTNLYYTQSRFNTAFSGKSTTDLTEGTNLYFTNARTRTAVSLTTTGTSGAATYSSSTGVLNIPQYADTNSGGTITSITAGTGLSGGTITTTGTISMPNTGTAGTYGSATQIPVFTTDAQGRISSVTNTTITSTAPGTNSVESTAAGTAYSFTGTFQKITLGTTSPTVTLPSAGTYLILTNSKVDYVGLTTLSTGNVNLKIRRSNNTATDVLASLSFPLAVLTVANQTAADVDIRQFLYTTSTSGDILELWGQVTNTISVGSVQIAAGGATLTAVRIY